MKRTIAIVCLLASLSCVKRNEPDYWPTDAWRVSRPEPQGVSSVGLLEALKSADELGLTLHSLLVIRHGRIVLDAAWWPTTRGRPHDIASCTKSITATLVGIALTDESLDLDDRVGDWIEDAGDAADSRVRDLLTMRSGLEKADELELARTHDAFPYLATRLRLYKTGTTYRHSSGDSHWLMLMLEEATEGTAREFADARLFAPLGIRSEDVSWPEHAGTPRGWADLHMRPRDLAKIGLMYLHNGQWEDRRILSKGFVRNATRKHIPIPSDVLDYGYGFQWWTFGSGRFMAQGRNGQYLVVIPDLDAIVVATGKTPNANPANYGRFFVEHLLPAMGSRRALPQDDVAFERLAAYLNDVGSRPKRQPLRLPSQAMQVSGDPYTLEDNAMGASSVSFALEDAEPSMHMRIHGVDYILPIGPVSSPAISADDPERDGSFEGFDLPVASTARWENGALVVEVDEIENIYRWEVRAEPQGDGLALRLTEKTNTFPLFNVHGVR